MLTFTLLTFSSVLSDLDGDGLDDGFELACAQKFKPVVYLAEREEYGPTTVEKFLQGCQLRKYGSCSTTYRERAQPHGNPLNQTGLCLWETAVAIRYAACGFQDPDKTIGHVEASTLATKAGSENCAGSGNCYIRCLACQQTGKCNNLGMDQAGARGMHGEEALANNPFYVHVFPDVGGSVQIQYWFFYAFNGPTDGFGTHQGDWEHFSVRTDRNCLSRLGYVPFAHGDPPAWTNATLEEEGGHAVVYSAINSHATYLTVGTHPGGTPISHDYTSKGDRWFPKALINGGESTCAKSGRQPMQADTTWIDYTDVWGSDSGFDGSLNNGACDSGPHLQWNQQMPDNPC